MVALPNQSVVKIELVFKMGCPYHGMWENTCLRFCFLWVPQQSWAWEDSCRSRRKWGHTDRAQPGKLWVEVLRYVEGTVGRLYILWGDPGNWRRVGKVRYRICSCRGTWEEEAFASGKRHPPSWLFRILSFGGID